ncbi:MAG: rhomboid family intramembrane serine protease [Bradymonadia bacterium]
MRPAQFPLKRPPSPHRRDRQSIAVLMVLGFLMWVLSAGFGGWWDLWPAMGPTLVALMVWGPFERGQRRDRHGAAYDVTLDGHALVVPRHPGDVQPQVLPLNEIDGVMHWSNAKGGTLIVETPGRTVRLEGKAFQSADALPRLIAHLNLALARTCDLDRLKRIHRRRAATRAVFSARPVLTYGLLTILVAIYVLEDALGALEQPSRLILLGANQPTLTLSREPYRLVSATFLHAGLLHIGLNALGLLALGRILEHLVGRSGLWAIFMASALGGALASALVGRALLSVGVSTALSGMLGAFWMLQRRFPEEMPTGIRQSPGSWAFLLGVNVALPILVPIIDFASHLGGFLVGLAVTWALTLKRADLSNPLHPGPTTALALVGLVVCMWGLGRAGEALLLRPGDQMAWTAGAFAEGLADPDLSWAERRLRVFEINEMAYRAATEGIGTTEAGLRHALQGMTALMTALDEMKGQVVSRSDRLRLRGECGDTLGAVQFRLGLTDEAYTTQLQAMRDLMRSDASSQGVLATQLMRFALHTQVPDGQLEQHLSSPLERRLEAPGLPTGAEVLAIVESSKGPVGLLAARQSAEGQLFQVRGPALPEGVRFRVFHREVSATPVFVDTGHWGWWPIDPQAPTLTPLGADQQQASDPEAPPPSPPRPRDP